MTATDTPRATHGFTQGQNIKIDAPDAPEINGQECVIIAFDAWGAYTLVNRTPRPYDKPGHVPRYRALWEEMIPVDNAAVDNSPPQVPQQKPVVVPSVRVIKNKPFDAPALSGNACGKCGGLMVRTGKCETCQFCGDSPGGCS